MSAGGRQGMQISVRDGWKLRGNPRPTPQTFKVAFFKKNVREPNEGPRQAETRPGFSHEKVRYFV